MNNNLCKFSTDKSQGLESKLWCNILSQPCGCYRFCTTDKCIKMTSNYSICPFRAKAGDQMSRTKKDESINGEEIAPVEESTTFPIEEPKPVKKEKPKTQKIICNIISKSDKKFAIDFNGGGIAFRDNESNKTEKVEVIFTGNYGEKSFEILSYRFI